MYAALMQLFILAGCNWYPDYDLATRIAIDKDLPLVTYVGMQPNVVSEYHISTRADWLNDNGFPEKCVILAKPSNGKMYWAKTFSPDEPVIITPVAQSLPFPDDLDEVNAKRSQLGLHALARDPALTLGAWKCAQYRAQHGIKGHTNNDFQFLEGTTATAGGCAALEVSWGWQSCCWDDPKWTVAGASSVVVNGIRYTQIFVR